MLVTRELSKASATTYSYWGYDEISIDDSIPTLPIHYADLIFDSKRPANIFPLNSVFIETTSYNLPYIHAWIDLSYRIKYCSLSIDKRLQYDNLRLVNIKEIENYLQNDNIKIEDLKDIIEYTNEIFKNKCYLRLEIYNDPEIEYGSLALIISEDKYTNNTMNNIRAIRNKYKYILVNSKKGLTITTEFD